MGDDTVLTVELTGDRRLASRHSLVKAHPETLAALGVSAGPVVLTNTFPATDDSESFTMKAIGTMQSDPSISTMCLAMDKTLRMAACVDPGVAPNLTVHSLSTGRRDRLRHLLARALADKYVVARVSYSTSEDIERAIVRVPSEMLLTLGLENGDRLTIEYPVTSGQGSFDIKTITLPAFASPPTLEPEQRHHEQVEEGGKYARRRARLPLVTTDTGTVIDVPGIALDADARYQLQCRPLEPVRVHRNGLVLLGRQAREFGAIVILNVLAVTQVLPFRSGSWTYTVLVLFGSILFAFGLIVLNQRSR